MASVVQICNLALSRLGASTITSLTDNTTEARLCNTLFNDMVDEVSLEGVWSCTVKRATLNKTTTTPNHGFTYEYQLPVNPFCLKVLSLDEYQPGDNPYAVEGDKLLTNATSMKIRYIGRITNPQEFDTGFKRALVTRLSAELALPITGEAALANRLMARYERDIEAGLASDGQQGSIEIGMSSALRDVR